MAGTSNKLVLEITVDDKGSPVVRQFGDAVSQAGGQARDAADTAKTSWQNAATGMNQALELVRKAFDALVRPAVDWASGSIQAAMTAEAENAKLAAVIRATGGAAGFTSAQLQEMAGRLQEVAAVDDEVIKGGMAILATFRNIKGDAFEAATMAALDMSAVMGQDLKSSMIQLGKALNDPAEGLTALSRIGVQFTEGQKAMIEKMLESGDVAGAQKVILKELADEFGGAATAAGNTFGGQLRRLVLAYGDLREEVGASITDNMAFVEAITALKEIIFGAAENAQDNKQALREMAKDGLLVVIDAIAGVVIVSQALHLIWDSLKIMGSMLWTGLVTVFKGAFDALRLLLAPFDLLMEGLVKLGAIKVNPFTAVAETIEQVRLASQDATDSIVTDANKTNQSYQNVIDKVADIRGRIAATAATSRETTDKIVGHQAEQTEAVTKKADAVVQAEKAILEAIRKSAVEIEGIGKSQYDKDMARIVSEAEKYEKLGVDKVLIAKFVEMEITAAKLKAAEEHKKIQQKSTEEFLVALEKETEALGKELNERYFAEKAATAKIKEIIESEAVFAATENERAINRIIADAEKKVKEIEKLISKERADAKAGAEAIELINRNKNAAILARETENATKIAKLNSDLVKDIRGWEEAAYHARIAEIQAEGQKALDLGAKWENVSAWMERETYEAHRKMKLSSGSFFDGMEVGYEDMKRKSKSAADYGVEVFNTFAQSSKTAISDILFDAIKKGSVDMGEVWDKFCGGMLRKLTDTIADMITTAIAKDIMMMFKADWTKDSSNVLGIINGAISLWNWATAAEGGYIPGTARTAGDSRANDTIPALLSPGEFVVPRTAVTAESRPVLEYLRANKTLPTYAEGGFVEYPRLRGYMHPDSPMRYHLRDGWFVDPDAPDRGWAETNPWQTAWDTQKAMGRHFSSKQEDQWPKVLQDWVEGWMEGNYGDGYPTEGSMHWGRSYIPWHDFGDELGRLNMPHNKTRVFYMDDTYADYEARSKWLSNLWGGIINTVATAIAVYVGGAMGKGLIGGAYGKAVGAGTAAATTTYIRTKGNFQDAFIAGIVAAAMVGIADFFDSTPDHAVSYLDAGEFEAWQLDPQYTDALYSDVGQGSTAAWWDNMLASAGRFVGKKTIQAAIKIGAGHLGRDGSNQGHATFDYDSTDDGGIFRLLADFMDTIAPKSTPLSLNFISGGTLPAFSDGGTHRGGWRLVGERGPELEFTGPSRIYSSDDSKSLIDNADLIAELRSLRAGLDGLRADFNKIGFHLLQRANKTGKAIDGFTVDGAPAVRVSVQ